MSVRVGTIFKKSLTQCQMAELSTKGQLTEIDRIQLTEVVQPNLNQIVPIHTEGLTSSSSDTCWALCWTSSWRTKPLRHPGYQLATETARDLEPLKQVKIFLPIQIKSSNFNVHITLIIFMLFFPLGGPKNPRRSIPEETLGEVTSVLNYCGQIQITVKCGTKKRNLNWKQILLGINYLTEPFPQTWRSKPSSALRHSSLIFKLCQKTAQYSDHHCEAVSKDVSLFKL